MQVITTTTQFNVTNYPLRVTTMPVILIIGISLSILLLLIVNISKFVATEYSVQHYLVGRTHITTTSESFYKDAKASDRVGRVLIPKSSLHVAAD